MRTFFAIIAVFSPIWGTLLIVFAISRWENRQYNKIKFKEFKKFYELNPERWNCQTDYVMCKITTDYDYEVFAFNFIDECKYRLWRRSLNKTNMNKEHVEATQRMLDAVKEDIAKAKAQEVTNSMAGITQLLKDIKTQGIDCVPPSLIELLKKYDIE